MRTFRAPSIAAAHEWAVRTVLEKGYPVTTENGEATIESEPLAMELRDPLAEPMASPASRFQQRFLEQYADALLHGTDAVFEYDYHSRLFAWGEGLERSGVPVAIDQVAYIVGKLTEAPESRRAIAVTWNPATDEVMRDCPCLQLVECQLRAGRLAMQVVFRSNDMLSAAGSNMFALVGLQKEIAEQLGATVGTYTHISLVPHLYHRRDAADLARFCARFESVAPVAGACAACRGCPGV